jgi:CRP-like cAMP-binding protein
VIKYLLKRAGSDLNNKEIFNSIIFNYYKNGKENIDLARNEIEKGLIQKSEKILYIKGEVISEEGTCDDKLYFIERGKIIMSRKDASKKEFSCGYLMPGEIFGLSSYIDMPNEVSYKALTNCNIYTLPVNEIRKLSKESEEYRSNFTNLIANMSRFINVRQGSLIMGGCRSSFVQFISEHFYDFGRIDENGDLLVTLDVNLIEIAEILNMTRETLSRIVSEMKKEGIIENKRRFLKIFDLDKFFA